MYKNFEKLCKDKGVKVADVSKATGVSQATFSNWKSGRYIPKVDKLQKIADYFGVPLSSLTHDEDDSQQVYYFTAETAAAAQELFENKELRGLMDAARGCAPEQIKNVTLLLKAMKETNPDG